MGAFARDLRWSVGVWTIDPRLPIAALSLSLCQVALFAAPRGSVAASVMGVSSVHTRRAIAKDAGDHVIVRR